MKVRAIRGAITIEKDDKESVLSSTKLLLKEIFRQNKISIEDIISIIFTATKDISSIYPAVAARELGITKTPLICCQEMYVENSLPLCIRAMVNISTDLNHKVKHIYLRKAKALRPDLSNDKDERFTIAIDGPAGAGKSTIAKHLAKKLNILYLDTGAMYRAFALKVLESGLNPESESDIDSIIDDTDIDVQYEDGVQTVYLDSVNITDKIRTEEISKAASSVATIPKVRLKLVDIQRSIGMKTSLVMDGRDIGTYVLPDASLKIFLTATAEERARRRHNELTEKGVNTSYTEVLNDIKARDYNDSKREFAPLRKADDAVLIDSTDKTIEEVIQEIEELVRVRGHNFAL